MAEAAKQLLIIPKETTYENRQTEHILPVGYRNLAILKALFAAVEPKTIEVIVRSEPTGVYSRRLWFLWEWLRKEKLDIEDATKGNFVPLINDDLQYPGQPRDSRRHRVRNNLPGTRGFCPLIRKTAKLERFIEMKLSQAAINQTGKIHADLLSRAAAFLLLEDFKATYTIEGEAPPHSRIERWGKIIGKAGQRQISIQELKYLQTIVIADNRFVELGYRTEGSFVGEHDRSTGMPIPDHISARAEDLESLLSGLMETYQFLGKSDFD